MYIAKYKLWFEPRPSRLDDLKHFLELVENRFNGYSLLSKSYKDGKTPADLIKSYLSDNNHIRTTETREARYGEFYQMSVSASLGHDNIHELVKNFIAEITYGSNSIPYIAIYKKRKGSYYIQVWISDREWGMFKQVYTRDYYYHAKTGKPVGKKHPEAVKRLSKGQAKLDEQNNPIYKNWATSKVRIFQEDYKTAKQRFYDLLETILIAIKNTIKNKLEMKMKRLWLNIYDHDDKVHLYREISATQQYVLSECYQKIIDTFDWEQHSRDISLGLEMNNVDIKNPYGDIPKKILNLFYKYRNRFKKGSYHDIYQNEKSLFKGISYKDALKNVIELRQQFKQELNELTGA